MKTLCELCIDRLQVSRYTDYCLRAKCDSCRRIAPLAVVGRPLPVAFGNESGFCPEIEQAGQDTVRNQSSGRKLKLP